MSKGRSVMLTVSSHTLFLYNLSDVVLVLFKF